MPGGRKQNTAPQPRRGGASAVGPHWGEKWLPEARRGYAAIVLGLVFAVPAQLAVQSGSTDPFARTTEMLLVFIASYLGFYILVTGLAFRLTPAHRYRAWAESSVPGTWVQHWLLGTQPGPGLAQSISAFALFLGVFCFPRSGGDGTLPGWVTGCLVALLVIEAWLTVVMTYSVAYLMQDARKGYSELEFPDSQARRWTDYFYFSAGVSTTFATSDVDVRTSAMRRTVTGHSILAFGFNTVILAAVVSLLMR